MNAAHAVKKTTSSSSSRSKGLTGIRAPQKSFAANALKRCVELLNSIRGNANKEEASIVATHEGASDAEDHVNTAEGTDNSDSDDDEDIDDDGDNESMSRDGSERSASGSGGESGSEDEAASEEDVRSAPYRQAPTRAHFRKMDKALYERMKLIDRHRTAFRKETFAVLGTTGNVYTVNISSEPRCDCPDFQKNQQESCKHIIYIFLKILRIPQEDHRWYQEALTRAEVADIFRNNVSTSDLIHTQFQQKYRAKLKERQNTNTSIRSGNSTMSSSSSGSKRYINIPFQSANGYCYEEQTQLGHFSKTELRRMYDRGQITNGELCYYSGGRYGSFYHD